MDPTKLLFAPTHEWLAVDDSTEPKSVRLGISDFAVNSLTDIVYLKLPEVGRSYTAEESLGEVESVKAVSEIYSPAGIEITEVNEQLPENLTWLSEDPYGKGWIAVGKLIDESAVGHLLDHDKYQQQISEEH